MIRQCVENRFQNNNSLNPIEYNIRSAENKQIRKWEKCNSVHCNIPDILASYKIIRVAKGFLSLHHLILPVLVAMGHKWILAGEYHFCHSNRNVKTHEALRNQKQRSMNLLKKIRGWKKRERESQLAYAWLQLMGERAIEHFCICCFHQQW